MGHSHGIVAQSDESRALLRFRLGAVLLLAAASCAAQFIGALITGSIALMAESVHMVVDLLGLIVAFAVAMIPSSRSEESRKRFEAWSALLQSTLLMGVGVYAAIRGLQALIAPHSVAGFYVLIFASVALVANLVAVAILYRSRGRNLNLRAAFLEVISDALGSLIIICSGIAMLVFGFRQADGIATLGLAVLMLSRGFSVMRSSLGELGMPRRKLTAALALLLSVVLGLGVSQLHKLVAPSDFHIPLAAADSYDWTGRENPELSLTMTSGSGVAILSDGCSSAASLYQYIYGGLSFAGFEPMESDCEGSLDEALLETKVAYYGEGLKSLEIRRDANSPSTALISDERARDQERTDLWMPAIELLFKL